MEIENFHEINIIKDTIFSPSITESLQNIIYNEGYVTYKVYRRKISTGGGNYLGALFEVDIKGKTSDQEKEISLFAKVSIGRVCPYMSISWAYAKEQIFYDELKKVFEELEEDAGVPEAERLRTVKSYKVLSLDAVIMENLRKQGYTILDRLETFSLEYAELSIKQLATFHGLAYVLKEKKPEYLNRMLHKIPKSVLNKKTFEEIFQIPFKANLSTLEEEWQTKLEPYFFKFAGEFAKMFEMNCSEINCLCHGDYNQNNVLIKTVNHKIVDLIPIDYQQLHIGNPLNDFFYFVYLGSDREFRKKYLMQLKNLYYDTLKFFLKYFNINVEDVYSTEKFEVDFESRREMGLVFASLLYPIMLVSEEDAAILQGYSFANVNLKKNPKYYERIMGVLEEFEELGYFSSS